MLTKTTYGFLCLCLLSISMSFAQNGKQKALESRRLELTREIQKINELRDLNKSKQKSQITLIEDLIYKVSVRENLIKVTNQQANLLTREINNNQKAISANREELKILKDNYASMIRKSYKNKNKQSRIMFLLSSSNFKQAYKRIQYLNQYSDYQKMQGENIRTKTEALQKSNQELLKKKTTKEQLIADNKKEQNTLEKERKSHEKIMSAIKKDLNKYTAQIREREREARKIDRAIDKIIRDAIAKSNKKSGTASSSKGFALTAEAKVLAKDFLNNKGKLPWPVEKGVVKVRYGRQPSPIDRTVTINSNGVRISTEKNAKVRAVFAGEVLKIQKQKRSNPAVLIKHGNYITVYKNLGKLFVKPGDKVTTKQDIGEVFTNPATGESILRFSLYKDNATQNPSSWIFKM